jgi:hypothetical protein
MKGKKWEHCQGIGVTPEQREQLLNGYTGKPVTELSTAAKAMNFAKSLFKHAVDGMHRASSEVIVERVKICSGCDKLGQKGECLVCGCPVEAKATWRSEECPLGHWPKQESIEGGGCNCSGS